MAKGLFIGFGGCGIQTVSNIKAKLRQEYSSENEMYQDNTFIFMDTDTKTVEAINKNVDLIRQIGNTPIPDSEFIDFSKTNPRAIYDSTLTNPNEASKRFQEWIIPQDTKSGNSVLTLPDKELRLGSGAIRMVGRTAIYRNWRRIINDIDSGISNFQTIVQNLNNDEDRIQSLKNNRPNIWVFAASNGGTGSLALLDILYILDRVYKTKLPGEPFLQLILFTPKPFIDVNKNNDSYKLNGFATLWELNAFREDAINGGDGQKFKYYSCQPDLIDWKDVTPWKLYSLAIPIDTETNNAGKISLDDLFTNTAEMCFYLHIGAAGRESLSRLDNDIEDTNVKTNPRKDGKTPFAWSNSLVAMGYKAIRKPTNELKKYIKARLKYELFDYGLLGHSYEVVHKNDTDKELIKKKFAKENIFKYLIDPENIDTPSGDDSSLYNSYKNELNQIRALKFDKKPNKDEWTLVWSSFSKKIDEKIISLKSMFEADDNQLSKSYYLKLIKESVNVGVDKCIKEKGLDYTKYLLHIVDDNYCELISDMLVSEKTDNNAIKAIITEIEKNVASRKNIDAVYALLEKYRAVKLKDLVFDNVVSILKDLTETDFGYLEILRRGNNQVVGLTGLISTVSSYKESFLDEYMSLSKQFKDTRKDVLTYYIPQIYDYSDGTRTWKDGNFFENLYRDVVTLDDTSKAIRKQNGDLGVSPKLDNLSDIELGKSMQSIISDLINNFGSSYFSRKALTDNASISDIIEALDSFIDSKIDSSEKISAWINDSLEITFNKIYDTREKKQEFVKDFGGEIEILFPQKSGNIRQYGETRFMYVGNSISLASDLGYKASKDEHKFLTDNKLNDRFLVLKMESAHNFFDYKYFDLIENYYNEYKKDIVSLKQGCHIHKKFNLLNINVVDKRIMELLIYDGFFKSLSTTDEELFNSVFSSDVESVDDFLSGILETDNSSSAKEYLPIFSVKSISNTFQIELRNLLFSNNKLAKSDIINYNLGSLYSFENFINELNTKAYELTALEVLYDYFKVCDSTFKSKLLNMFVAKFDDIYKVALRDNLGEGLKLINKTSSADKKVLEEIKRLTYSIKDKNIFN